MNEETEVEEIKVLTKKQQLKQQITDLQAKVEQLEKTAKSDAQTASYKNSRLNAAESELQQMHVVFDGLGVPRKQRDKDSTYCSDVDLTLIARMVQFMSRMIPAVSTMDEK